MKVKDFDSYKVPNRKPWAILLVLLVVGVLVWLIFFRGGNDDELSSEKEVAVAQESGVPPSDSVSENADSSAAVPVAASAVIPTGDVALMLDAAAQLAAEDRLVDARMKYIDALKSTDDPALKRQIEEKLAPINIELIGKSRYDETGIE